VNGDENGDGIPTTGEFVDFLCDELRREASGLAAPPGLLEHEASGAIICRYEREWLQALYQVRQDDTIENRRQAASWTDGLIETWQKASRL